VSTQSFWNWTVNLLICIVTVLHFKLLSGVKNLMGMGREWRWVQYCVAFSLTLLTLLWLAGVYLPLLWEPAFCWRTPLALGYTRGHFSALVPMEADLCARLGARANIDTNDEAPTVFLPLMDYEGKILPVHFLQLSEVCLLACSDFLSSWNLCIYHPNCRYLCLHYLPLLHKNPEDRRWGNPAWMQHSPMLRQKAECLFWYRPIWVVPEQRPLNGCCCCCCTISRYWSFSHWIFWTFVLLTVQ